MTTRRAALRGLAAGAASLWAGRGFAQDDSVISILVGAASSMDFTARMIAEQMRQALGRPVIAVPKLGAGQRLALGECKRAAPDGRTLVFATSGPFAIYPHIYTKLDYDPVADFTPIIGVSKFDVAISTQPSVTHANTLKELIAWAKARKEGDAVFGSAPGNGSLSHFLGISIGLATHTKLTHAAYKDSGVGLLDLAGGRLPIMITGLQPQVEFHKAGKIKILAVSGDKRSPLVPDVPTLAEAGIPISSSTSTGLFGPAGMAPALVKRYHDAVAPMLTNAAMVERLTQQGMTIWPASPTELAAAIAEERGHFEKLVRASGYVRQDA